MSRIKVLPHPDACPLGIEFDAVKGMSVCDNLLKNDVDIEHACEKVCACTTCHFNAELKRCDGKCPLFHKCFKGATDATCRCGRKIATWVVAVLVAVPIALLVLVFVVLGSGGGGGRRDSRSM